MHLARSGREITVVEREMIPGGRAGVQTTQGFTFDTGPVVLTMPEIAAEAFDALEENMADWLTLERLDPSYRTFFPDGSSLDILDDTERMSDQIRLQLGPDAAAGYEDYVTYVTRLYNLQFADFMNRNFDSPLDVLTPNLLRLVAMGGFRRMDTQARNFLRDPRLLRAFTFQSMYAGVSPQRALALYSVISYMDCVAGVYAPKGGMNRLPAAMVAAATKHGVSFRFGTSVSKVEHSGGRARSVLTEDGDRIPCDVAVLSPDLPTAQRDLLGRTPWSVRRLRMSPSAVVLLAGSSADYPRIAHHNIHFGRSWRTTFQELIENHELMSDPSFFVSHLNATDPSLAPRGSHAYYVLFPAPNQRSGIDWENFAPAYLEHMINTLQERGYSGFEDGLQIARMTSPADWQARGMAGGSPFAAAHTFWQTGPFRPGNLLGENIVFAGSGTIPGVGVPMVLLSGQLAARRIKG